MAESRLETISRDIRARIEQQPVRAFGFAFTLGVGVTLLFRLLLPLLVIAGLVAAGFWFFSQKEQ